MKRITLLFWAMLGGAWCATAQSDNFIKEQRKIYEERVQQTHLNDVYIPKDLDEAFIELNSLISPEASAQFKAMTEREAAEKLHYSLSRWIWHNWGFMEGSRLSHALRAYGIKNPEDMATFVVVAYHRQLNAKPLDLQPLADYLTEKRKKYEAERRKRLE